MKFLLFIGLGLALSSISVAQEEGLITADRVNVRARPKLASEVLFQFSKGVKIPLGRREGDWFAVPLPAQAFVYVAKPFLEIRDAKGTVRGSRVQLRAGAGKAFSSLGFLNDRQEVQVREIAGEWVKIEAPEGYWGWVSGKYVAVLESHSKEEAAIR